MRDDIYNKILQSYYKDISALLTIFTLLAYKRDFHFEIKLKYANKKAIILGGEIITVFKLVKRISDNGTCHRFIVSLCLIMQG